MTLVKWTPRHMSLFDEMDNMVNSVFGRDWNFPAKRTDWAPAVDVKETDDLFLITADIPGLTKKDVKVNIANSKITIAGDVKVDAGEDNSRYHYRERRYGSFKRTFNLPESINEEKISASFKNGILEIALPKHENVLLKEREIKVN